MIFSLRAVFTAVAIRAAGHYNFLELEINFPDVWDAGVCPTEHSTDMNISRSPDEKGDFSIQKWGCELSKRLACQTKHSEI